MSVSYSQITKPEEDDILVINEDDPNIITYSKSMPIALTRMCRNNCPYCGFHRKDTVVVPYSTIRQAKNARAAGARELLFVSGERPDKFPFIRATLDLWGFESFIEYVYTVCELGFLEGLLPVIELGFLSPIEMKRLAEVSAINKIMLDSVDPTLAETLYKESPGKKLELRLKSLQWAGKLNFPTITGFMVKIGETKSHRQEILKEIASIHKQYGHIHEVLLQNFVPEPGTPFEKKKPADMDTMLDTFELARSILPEDVPVTISPELVEDIEPFIKAGLRDLGRITHGGKGLIVGQKPMDEVELRKKIESLGFELQQRFPLRKAFILEGKYSKKLGQVLDNYRYKVKKEIQEKSKEIKLG
jgi:FO synthase subunit 1